MSAIPLPDPEIEKAKTLITFDEEEEAKKWNYAFVTNKIIAGATSLTSLDINYLFPLFLFSKFPDVNQNKKKEIPDLLFSKTANLNEKIIKKISLLSG